MLTNWNALSRAFVGAVLVTSGIVVSVGPAVADAAPAPKVADACSLLKPREVKAALRSAPKSLRPVHVDAGVATSPTAGASTTRSCALGLLLNKNVGGSVQVLTSPVRVGVCPPKAAKRDRAKVAGTPVVLVRSGKSHKLGGVVFAEHGTCVSVAAVLSNGRSIPSAAYLALARNALRRLSPPHLALFPFANFVPRFPHPRSAGVV